MVRTYSQLYLDARKALIPTEGADMAGQIARNLLCAISKKSHEQILLERGIYASEDICDGMDRAVVRIQNGEPLAYVIGEWDFYGLTLYVDRNVLIPRDDTCAVTELAIAKVSQMGKDPRVLDLCTGSGCIGLAIASKVKDARVTLGDISREALAVAKKNVIKHHLSARVSCFPVNALEAPAPVLGKFDLIVSNPPYITTGEMLELPKSVKGFEPHLALHGGVDGLDFYRTIAANYRSALKPGGYLCFEFGMGQGDAVCEILQQEGYTILERTRDYNEIERACLAQFGRKED